MATQKCCEYGTVGCTIDEDHVFCNDPESYYFRNSTEVERFQRDCNDWCWEMWEKENPEAEDTLKPEDEIRDWKADQLLDRSSFFSGWTTVENKKKKKKKST